MKMSRFLTVMALVLVLVLGLAACGPTVDPTPTTPSTPAPGTPHSCESVCPECGLCLDAECAENVCAGKCAGHSTTPAGTTPVITVDPAEIEINAGDEVDLMFGVTVTDEGDEAPSLRIESDDDFDANEEGVYTITYVAVNKFGNEARATRTITVNKALSALTLEVQANKLGEAKWTGNLLNFKNKEFVTLNADATLDKQSGVFYNASSSAITVTVSNSDYAVVAIITANGVVVEGRDGANNKLVNAKNPIRTSTTATLPDVNAVANDMVIPAGGYAIVVQNGYCGTTVDSDGRNFINYNVIGEIGNVVRLLWADTAEIITPYVDQAPVISGHTTTIYAGNGDFVLDEKILEGVKAVDDNGTFDPTDDVAATVTIKNDGGFDISKAGTYTITLEATDGTNTTTVTRTVEVTTEAVEIKINNNVYTTVEALVAIDKDLTSIGKNLFIIYTPNYTGKINFTNGHGEAFIINKYGEIVRIYDGANAKYYDAENKSGVQNGTCTAAGYLNEAFASRQEGEYLLVAPNGNGNVSRGFLLNNRTIGAKVTLPGITFAAHECESKCAKCGGCLDEACTEAACATKCSCHACESVCATCGKCTDTACTEEACASKCEGHEAPAHTCESVCEHCGKCADAACTEEVCASKCAGHEKSMFVTIGSKKYEAVDGMWAINQEITTSNAASKAVWVFNKSYTGNFNTNGYGVAVVLDEYGRVIRVYDGANGGYWLPSGKQASAHFTTSTYATVAWSELQEGETLVVFPNGADGNKARQIGLDSRYLFNQKMNLTGVSFADPNKTITIGSKTYTATEGKWLYNTAVTTSNAASYAIIIYDKGFTGTFNTNGYGVAVVLNAEGKVARVYDGANGGYWLPSGKQASAHFTTSTYATVAWSELQEGETLVILPNGGSEGNAARQVGLDCRYLFGQKMSITGFTFQ